MCKLFVLHFRHFYWVLKCVFFFFIFFVGFFLLFLYLFLLQIINNFVNNFLSDIDPVDDRRIRHMHTLYTSNQAQMPFAGQRQWASSRSMGMCVWLTDTLNSIHISQSKKKHTFSQQSKYLETFYRHFWTLRNCATSSPKRFKY